MSLGVLAFQGERVKEVRVLVYNTCIVRTHAISMQWRDMLIWLLCAQLMLSGVLLRASEA